MKTLEAAVFKGRYWALLDEVVRSGQTITITKSGKPVARLVPVRPAKRRYPQDGLRGTVEILGDIVSPTTLT